MTVTYAIFLKGSYMRLFFRILLTITATFWMVAVYIIKTGECIYGIPSWAFGLFLLAIPVFISLIIIEISKSIEPEQLTMCEEFSLTDRDFLPTYLGYFFVSLSINDNITMSILYAIVFVFVFLSQAQYFNPVFLLFGYHYYNIRTSQGSNIFVIARGPVIRNKKNIGFQNLRRINDTTFIERKG